MPGYLNKIKRFQHDEKHDATNDAALYQFHLEYEIDEFNEKRSALLARLREGHIWLLDQHRRWQSGDLTAVDDAEFSRAWNGWWELDHRLRADHGVRGCIYGPDNACPEGFPCQGCADLLAATVVAQLALAGAIGNGSP